MHRSLNDETLSRRGLLTHAAGATWAAAATEAHAQAPVMPVTPVNCAVIGLGRQGRDLLAALGRVPGANTVAICDTYAPFLNRSRDAAPKAVRVADARQVFDRKDVAAVFVATPTHRHRELVEQALQAGKDVYCEAPIAHTMDDARAIARAARTSKSVFQGGLQFRTNPQHLHVLKFLRAGILGKTVGARAQWHKKTSWRTAAPTPEREREMNWRLSQSTSAGLVGEIGIHSLDTVSWFTKALPTAVSGFGHVAHWQDGRSVPDTVHCVLEFPGGLRCGYDATLANSFDSTYELLMGTDAAVMLRGERAWMFKEVDAPLQGWEVYARKEQVGDETGIALVADATKLLALGKIPGKDKSPDEGKDALYYAVEAFLDAVRGRKPTACGPTEAFQATVVALKTNEAVVGNTRINLERQWFELA